MAEPNRLADKMADAARAVWVDAARDILMSGGVAGLNLRGLAASLGVTTGAFYSVFSGLEDLHEALRQRWLDQNVTPMIEAIAEAGEDGFQQYLAALRVTILEDASTRALTMRSATGRIPRPARRKYWPRPTPSESQHLKPCSARWGMMKSER